MTEVGTLEKTNAIIREAYTKKEGEVDLTEEYKNLIRECEGVIELCENAHMSNALYAPVFILAEAKKVIDHADRIFCYVNVDWRPVWAIRAFDQGKCRVRVVMRYIWELQRVVQIQKVALRGDDEKGS